MSTPWATETPIVSVTNLTKHFKVRVAGRAQLVRAVDGVSLDLHAGETLGLVGESGCGKSTLARLLVRLEQATAGTVEYEGRNTSSMSRAEVRTLRRNVQIVFQDPYDSLNGRFTIKEIIEEPWRINRSAAPPRQLQRARLVELLEMVGLAGEYLPRYPGELSGGQRQRVGIARALALTPRVLILDEPVSALDVSVQAQVLNLLRDLQNELGLAYLLIAHDLSVVRHVAQRVAVMYLGKVVEQGPTEDLYASPKHPYTQGLLAAVPSLDPDVYDDRGDDEILVGDLPNPMVASVGCSFRPRCSIAQERCEHEAPVLVHHGRRAQACHFSD